MRMFRTLAVVVGLALVLSACGLVNGFIPNQQVSNPLGINNQPVTLSQVTTPGLAPQATSTTTFSGTINGSFGDFDASKIPSGVKPNGFSTDLDVAATATLSSLTAAGGSAFPASFDVTQASLALTVKDGSGSPSFTLPPIDRSGTLLVLTKQSCSGTAPVTCTYSVKAGSALGAALMSIQLSSSEVNTLWQIITSGSKTNDATGTFSLTVDQPVPSDAQLTVTIVSKEGTLSF